MEIIRLNIGTSDIDRFTRIGRSLAHSTYNASTASCTKNDNHII